MAAKYFAYANGPHVKTYARNLDELRMNAIFWLAVQPRNMEKMIPCYVEKDGGQQQIVGMISFKWLNGSVYIIWGRTTDLTAYRSYYDLETTLGRYIDHDMPIDWIEILTLKGRQLVMTGGAEDVYLGELDCAKGASA